MQTRIKPLCPVFGECGGCSYQDIPYEEELRIKEEGVRALFTEQLKVSAKIFDPILASPKEYHYRNRLDMKLFRSKTGEVVIGFSPERGKRTIPVSACAIARQEISDFLPRLYQEAIPKLTAKYRVANLVVRSGDERAVHWGGIGRRSLTLPPENYFWTKIKGRKIFYSLDTFFQANLSILPLVIAKIEALPIWNNETVFYDLYGGVGLFGISLSGLVKKVILIEENAASIVLARYNVVSLGLDSMTLCEGRVEEKLPSLLQETQGGSQVAMVDPPRAGLSPTVVATLNEAKGLDVLLYLSCHPESLVRDLTLLAEAWQLERVMPLDFFPRTKHLETLVVLKRR